MISKTHLMSNAYMPVCGVTTVEEGEVMSSVRDLARVTCKDCLRVAHAA